MKKGKRMILMTLAVMLACVSVFANARMATLFYIPQNTVENSSGEQCFYNVPDPGCSGSNFHCIQFYPYLGELEPFFINKRVDGGACTAVMYN